MYVCVYFAGMGTSYNYESKLDWGDESKLDWGDESKLDWGDESKLGWDTLPPNVIVTSPLWC